MLQRRFSNYVPDPTTHPIIKSKSKEWHHPNEEPGEGHHELPQHPRTYSLDGPPRGKPHGLAPIRIHLDANKDYYW